MFCIYTNVPTSRSFTRLANVTCSDFNKNEVVEIMLKLFARKES